MGDDESNRCGDLESILRDPNAQPCDLRLQYLREITDNFSSDREIGRGGFGVVYMGVLPNGEIIAVKNLMPMPEVHERQFKNEVDNLMRVRHQNVVRFVGYCYETWHEYMEYNGAHVFVDKPKMLLCFEYMPKGSLDRYISDESCGLDWCKRYQIIKGICYGLHYLHKECEINASVIHLDLKPANILLDDNMVPKIADFGLSKLFFNAKIETCATTLAGSYGYMAPEYVCNRIITTKADIYSLGVIIIEMITGHRINPFDDVTSWQDFMEPILKKWRDRLKATPRYTSLEIDCRQIETSLEMGLNCIKLNRMKRPTTTEIIEKLNQWESKICCAIDEEMLHANKDSLGDMTQPGNVYNQATPSRNEPSPSYNMDVNNNTLHQYAQGPSDRHAEQKYHGSHFQQDTVGTTPSNYFEENVRGGESRVDGDSHLYRHENQDYPPDVDALPGIEGFQIVGEPRPGFTLTACGFPTNGTTLCNFQWVRHLENGIRQSIEGATMYDYVVTADDVGTLLAVDCTPMDDNGRQGDLVTEFANNGTKITCDPEMQSHIDSCISNGRAEFEVFVLQAYSPEEWELATLVLTRAGYQIKFKNTGEAIIGEKYSPNLQTKIPNGRNTQFVLVSSTGASLPFNTQGISEPNNEDYDIRLRDLMVLVMRTFQRKALDAKRKGKA